jgi:ribonuclease BN (tRNA processing enzyme)
MELQFLGTGAGQPSKSRNVSSLVLKLLDEINEVWMFDCGEGTQRQILETTIRPKPDFLVNITFSLEFLGNFSYHYYNIRW